jgi:hypothetical protein
MTIIQWEALVAFEFLGLHVSSVRLLAHFV